MSKWYDLAQNDLDCVANGQAVISNQTADDGAYHLTTGEHYGDNDLQASTPEGVDLLLEEFGIEDKGWKRV